MCATAGCVTSASPTSGPRPVTTLTTPFGKPASVNSCASSSIDAEVNSDGLMTAVQPAASAGASFQLVSVSGEFHGVMIAIDALRLVARVGEDALLVGRDDGALHLVGETRVVAEVVAHVADLGDDLARELAVVALLDLGQARRVGDRPGRRGATAAGRARTASAPARRRQTNARCAAATAASASARLPRAISAQALPVYGFSVGRYSPRDGATRGPVDVVVVPDQRFSALHASIWRRSRETVVRGRALAVPSSIT